MSLEEVNNYIGSDTEEPEPKCDGPNCDKQVDDAFYKRGTRKIVYYCCKNCQIKHYMNGYRIF